MKTVHKKLGQSGSTITVAIITVSLLGVFVSLAVEYTSSIARNAQRDRVFNNAVEIGDGCLELAFGGWRKLSGSVKAPPTNTFDVIPPPQASYFPAFPDAVISNFRVQAVNPMIELQSQNPPLSSLPITASPPETTGPGEGTFSYFYLATVDVTLPYARGTLTAKVRRVFEKRYTSAWNWAMLYNDDLELHPDSPLTLNGWVHSNEDIFVGNGNEAGPSPSPTATPDPNATPDPFPTPTPTPSPSATPNLTLTDRLTYAGNYTVGFHPDDTDHAGQTNIADAVTPADLPPGSEQVYYPFGWKPDLFNTTDTNVNNDGFREMIEKPSSGIDVVSSERLYNQATIAIEIDASNVVRVYSGTGPTKSLVTSSSGNTYAATAYGNAGNFVKPGYYIQDNRETANVRVVNFDVGEFVKSFPNHNTKGWNGIVHIRDNSASGTDRRGIRIVNGARVPTGGMTIVSDNPVYVQGDYNTGRTSSVETPSNLGDPTDPDVSGYTRQPTSIMADAITLLSNNWNDGNGSKSVAERVATNTTVNAALVAGNVPTSGGRYSGGGENFVRFLEDWSGKAFTYYGSMMGMFASKQSVGYWGKANVYEPPTLKWHFDRKLSVDDNGNPVAVPGYVSTVAYLQQQRWYLQY